MTAPPSVLFSGTGASPLRKAAVFRRRNGLALRPPIGRRATLEPESQGGRLRETSHRNREAFGACWRPAGQRARRTKFTNGGLTLVGKDLPLKPVVSLARDEMAAGQAGGFPRSLALDFDHPFADNLHSKARYGGCRHPARCLPEFLDCRDSLHRSLKCVQETQCGCSRVPAQDTFEAFCTSPHHRSHKQLHL